MALRYDPGSVQMDTTMESRSCAGMAACACSTGAHRHAISTCWSQHRHRTDPRKRSNKDFMKELRSQKNPTSPARRPHTGQSRLDERAVGAGGNDVLGFPQDVGS